MRGGLQGCWSSTESLSCFFKGTSFSPNLCFESLFKKRVQLKNNRNFTKNLNEKDGSTNSSFCDIRKSSLNFSRDQYTSIWNSRAIKKPF